MQKQNYLEPLSKVLIVGPISSIAASYGETNQAGTPLEVDDDEYNF